MKIFMILCQYGVHLFRAITMSNNNTTVVVAQQPAATTVVNTTVSIIVLYSILSLFAVAVVSLVTVQCHTIAMSVTPSK